MHNSISYFSHFDTDRNISALVKKKKKKKPHNNNKKYLGF